MSTGTAAGDKTSPVSVGKSPQEGWATHGTLYAARKHYTHTMHTNMSGRSEHEHIPNFT